MKLLRRMTSTVAACVEQAVDQLENHEAVVDAAIKQARQAAATAQVRLAGLQRDREQLKQRVQTLAQASSTWTKRAKQVASYNQGKALECVQRRNQADADHRQAQQDLEAMDQRLDGLSAAVERAQRDIDVLVRQRNLLRTRQATACASGALQDVHGPLPQDLADVLERWESRVVAAEYGQASTAEVVDSLAQEFDAQEQSELLQAQLQALLDEDDDQQA